jgi:hypothetical protein
MGCSAEGETEGFIDSPDGENTGVLSGHAYSVIDVFSLDYNEIEQGAINAGEKEPNYHQNHRLLRVRNPWGYGEWNLKWSEHEDYREKLDHFSNLLDSYYESEVDRIKKQDPNADVPEKYDPTLKDGTFLMCFKDWRSIYSNLFVAKNFKDEWSGFRIYS